LEIKYTSPVLESSVKQGYRVPSRDEVYAALLVHIGKLVKVRGLIFKKPVEKLVAISAVNYPIDVKCIDSKCMALNPVTREVIKDHGIIGSIVFIIQNPIEKPIITPSIDIYASESRYEEWMYDEQYSIPTLRIKAGRYYISFPVFLLREREYRLVIEPPIYYITEYTTAREYFKSFEALRKMINTIPLKQQDIIREIERRIHEYYLNTPVNVFENGLKILYEKKLIKPGDSLFLLNILD